VSLSLFLLLLLLFQAEHELRVAQTEFDRQTEVTRLLLEGISSTHVGQIHTHTHSTEMSPLSAYDMDCFLHDPCVSSPQVNSCFLHDPCVCSPQVNHLRCLHEFVEAQAAYHKQCHVHMQGLQKELGK